MMPRLRAGAALLLGLLLIGCSSVPVPVPRHADASLLTPCAKANQVPPKPWSDTVVADVIVDLGGKLEECAARHDALIGFETAK